MTNIGQLDVGNIIPWLIDIEFKHLVSTFAALLFKVFTAFATETFISATIVTTTPKDVGIIFTTFVFATV